MSRPEICIQTQGLVRLWGGFLAIVDKIVDIVAC